MLAPSQAMIHSPEQQLLRRGQQGDLDAFGQVYTAYEQSIYRHAYYLLGNGDDARDVRQETFIKAFQAIGSFRRECSMQTWLLKICGNLCRNRLRAQTRRHEVNYHEVEQAMGTDTLLEAAQAKHNPAIIFERSELAQSLWAALERLPINHREIIVLRDVEEMAFEDIARILNCSRASVPVKLFRARRLLKDRVKALLTDSE